MYCVVFVFRELICLHDFKSKKQTLLLLKKLKKVEKYEATAGDDFDLETDDNSNYKS